LTIESCKNPKKETNPGKIYKKKTIQVKIGKKNLKSISKIHNKKLKINFIRISLVIILIVYYIK